MSKVCFVLAIGCLLFGEWTGAAIFVILGAVLK